MVRNIPTIAVTGANGFLGTALCKHFAAKGWGVIGLVRNPSGQSNLSVTSWRAYDISQPLQPDLLVDVNYLIHTAYIKQSPQEQFAYDTNVTGAVRLLKNAKKHNVTKTIFISSMSAHSGATSVYGRQKLRIEQLCSDTHTVALRPGLILGNGGIVKQMSDFMRSKHVVPLIAGGKQPLQTIALYDLTRACEQALRPDISGVLVVATPKVYTYKTFYTLLAKRLKVGVAFIPVSYSLLFLVFRIARVLRLPLGLGEDNLRGLEQLRPMASQADLQKLGIGVDSLEEALRKVQL